MGALSASTRGVATSDILNRSRHSSLAGAVFLNNMHAADGGSCRSVWRLRWCGRTIGAPPVRMRLVPVRPKLPARELWETPRRYGRAEFGSTRSATPSSVLGTPATRSYDRSSSIVLRGRACRSRSRSRARPVRLVPAGGVLVDLFDELSWGHSCYKRLSAVSLAAGSDRRGSRWDLWTASASFLVGVGTGATVLLTGPARLEPIMFPREAAASPATLTTLSAATTVISHSPPYSPWPRTTSCPLWA